MGYKKITTEGLRPYEPEYSHSDGQLNNNIFKKEVNMKKAKNFGTAR